MNLPFVDIRCLEVKPRMWYCVYPCFNQKSVWDCSSFIFEYPLIGALTISAKSPAAAALFHPDMCCTDCTTHCARHAMHVLHNKNPLHCIKLTNIYPDMICVDCSTLCMLCYSTLCLLSYSELCTLCRRTTHNIALPRTSTKFAEICFALHTLHTAVPNRMPYNRLFPSRLYFLW